MKKKKKRRRRIPPSPSRRLSPLLPSPLPFLPAQRSNGSRAVLHVSAPGTAVIVALQCLQQFSVVEVVPQLYVEARAEHDAEQLEDRQSQANSPEDDQVILGRLEKLVDTTLKRWIELKLYSYIYSGSISLFNIFSSLIT